MTALKRQIFCWCPTHTTREEAANSYFEKSQRNMRGCGSVLAALGDTISPWLGKSSEQSQNTTNCEALINNQTALMDDSRSVSSGIIGENTENSFPLNILNSLFRAESMLPEKPFNTASINFSGCFKQESLGCWKSSPQKGCCLQKTHQLCSAGKSFDLFYTTEEANMGMKYGHGAKHKKRLNKMSNYVFPKPSHASRRLIPS